MKKGGLIAAIVSVLIVGALAIVLYCTWPAIKASINKSKYYTSEQVQEAYDKGYGDGINNETELNAQIEYYKNLTDEYYSQIVGYQSQVENYKQNAVVLQNNIDSLQSLKAEHEKTIETLESANAEQQETIKSLNSNIATLTEQVESLEQEKTNNLAKIDELNVKIAELTTQISNLQGAGEDKDTQINLLKAQKTELEGQVANLKANITNLNGQIESYNAQVKNLQSNVQQLESTNALNLQTINSLNAQILALNSQISELTLQIQNNGTTVASLNKKIEELEKSIEYYEGYIKSLQSGEKAIVTFEFDGSVINVQVVAKGSKVSIVDPVSTDYVIFNYWTVGGEKITLSDYTVNDSVTIVANVTYKFDVKFMVDNGEHNKQIVEKDHFANVPSNPSKDGYEFDGWTVNGVDIVDVSSYKIIGTTTFIAKFTKLHTVTFLYESETKSTQKVRNGEYASNVSVDSTDYKVFNGWTVNGGKVDVSSYKITADTTFIADITYKYDVIFMADGQQKSKQIVEKDHFATAPSNPEKAGYEFDGWTINGNDIVNVSSYKITGTTTFVAKFTQLHNVQFKYENSVVSTQTIRHGEFAKNVSVDNTIYKVFNGWKVVDSIVFIESYPINEDTTFIADITYKYDVKFMVDGSVHDSQIVEKDKFAVIPSTPIKSGYNFDGWTINGEDVIDVSNYKITESTTFIARFVSSSGLFDIDTGDLLMSWGDLFDIGYLSNSIAYGGLYVPSGFPADLKGNKLVIDSTITAIGSFCCLGNYFSEVVLPDSVTTLKQNSFMGSLLKRVILGYGIKTIETECFSGCSSLEFIFIPNSVTSIAYEAFSGCYSLRHIFIPASVKDMGWSSSHRGPFNGVTTTSSQSFTIYLEAQQASSTWNKEWNYSRFGAYPVKYGYSYSQYLSEVGLA